jgi:hypothetical protein
MAVPPFVPLLASKPESLHPPAKPVQKGAFARIYRAERALWCNVAKCDEIGENAILSPVRLPFRHTGSVPKLSQNTSTDTSKRLDSLQNQLRP